MLSSLLYTLAFCCVFLCLSHKCEQGFTRKDNSAHASPSTRVSSLARSFFKLRLYNCCYAMQLTCCRLTVTGLFTVIVLVPWKTCKIESAIEDEDLSYKVDSNQNRYPLDFRHTPWATRTLDTSNLPLTRRNFFSFYPR